jgi:phosphoglycerate-specific signal transduction histidine kinase
MEIDEDNVEENLADDLRKDFTIECNVTQLRGQIGSIGNIVPKVYHKNNLIDDVRMEYTSNNENVITIDDSGYYHMVSNGAATINVRILGNEPSSIDIPVIVEDVTNVEYNMVISPTITSLKQGVSRTISAQVYDNLNNKIDSVITLVASGTDNNHYSLIDNGDNTWTITNLLQSKTPLILTFSNDVYNLECTINVQLKAMY